MKKQFLALACLSLATVNIQSRDTWNANTTSPQSTHTGLFEKLLMLTAPFGRVHKLEKTFENGVSQQKRDALLVSKIATYSPALSSILLRAGASQPAKDTFCKEIARCRLSTSEMITLALNAGVSQQARDEAFKLAVQDYPTYHSRPYWLRASYREKLRLLLKAGITTQGKWQALKTAKDWGEWTIYSLIVDIDDYTGVRWHTTVCPFHQRAFIESARIKADKIIKMLRLFVWDQHTRLEAALAAFENGHYDIMHYMIPVTTTDTKATCLSTLISEAVSNDDLEILEQLIRFDNTTIAAIQAQAQLQSKNEVINFIGFLQKPGISDYVHKRKESFPTCAALFKQEDCLTYVTDPQAFILDSAQNVDRTKVLKRTQHKQTCLMWAVLFGNTDIVTTLLQQQLPKSYVNARDGFGYTALDYACVLNYERISSELVNAAHNYTFTNPVTSESKTKMNKNALIVAAQKAAESGNMTLMYNILARANGQQRLY